MNGRKIALITMMVVFVILIVFTAIFSRFVLDINFSDLTDQDSENQQEDPVDDHDIHTEETEKIPGEEEKEPEKEKEPFQISSIIKTAKVTMKGEKPSEYTIEKAEDLTTLSNQLNSLKLMKIDQSVALQGTIWEAQLSLDMENGTNLTVNLADSNISGSKTTLNDGTNTYESIEPVTEVRTFLEKLGEKEAANDLKIGEREFGVASRILLIDPQKLESVDAAASKANIQAALGQLKIMETYEGNINPGQAAGGVSIISLSNEDGELFAIELYETGILAYSGQQGNFYVCEPASLKAFADTLTQISSSYSVTPAHLALMEKSGLYRMEVTSTVGGGRELVGLIRDHAANLFSLLQEIHVSRDNLRTETNMYKKPDYHILIEFSGSGSYEIDIQKGGLLVKDIAGNIHHYTLIGDGALSALRSELDRVTMQS